MVLFSRLVVFLHQIVDLSVLHLRHLLFEFLLQLAQDLALPEPLADAPHAAHVLRVFLGGDQVQLVLLLTLRVEMLLILEGFEDVLETDLRGRRGLGARRFVPQRLHLLEVVVELEVGLIDVGLVRGQRLAEFLLNFADEIDEFRGFVPLEEAFVVDFAGHGLHERMLDPLGDVDDRFFLGEVAQENAEWGKGYSLIG